MTAGNSAPRHGKPKCGAKKRQGEGNCTRPAGWGTDHPLTGQCKLHGGCMPANRRAAQEDQARQAVVTYGLRRDINATDALLEEVQWTAGHVMYLREQVSQLSPDALTWGIRETVDKQATEFPGTDSTEAAAVNVWLELYHRERKHLVDVCKAAISVGIEERYVRLAEAQGQVVVEVFRCILGRLDLTEAQQRLASVVVPEELRRAAGSLGLN
jgi:hypothetical protein